jgi:hypothetical protein
MIPAYLINYSRQPGSDTMVASIEIRAAYCMDMVPGFMDMPPYMLEQELKERSREALMSFCYSDIRTEVERLITAVSPVYGNDALPAEAKVAMVRLTNLLNGFRIDGKPEKVEVVKPTPDHPPGESIRGIGDVPPIRYTRTRTPVSLRETGHEIEQLGDRDNTAQGQVGRPAPDNPARMRFGAPRVWSSVEQDPTAPWADSPSPLVTPREVGRALQASSIPEAAREAVMQAAANGTDMRRPAPRRRRAREGTAPSSMAELASAIARESPFDRLVPVPAVHDTGR